MERPGRKAPAEAPPPRKRGRPIDRDGRDTQASILQAALRQFGEAGYGDVSMVDIAVEAGVDKRALYYHFASKRALFQAARAEAFSRFVNEARARMLGQATARQRFSGYIDVYRTLHATDPAVLHFIAMAMVEGIADATQQDSLIEAGTELLGLLAAVIEDGIAAGEVSATIDPMGALQLLAAISIGISFMSMSTGPYPATLDALDRFTDGTFFTD